METNTKGKEVPRKVGTAPVMRDGIDYEFTLCLDIGMDHQCTPSKDRTGLFVDKTFRITERTGEQIAGWLSGSAPVNQSVNQESMVDHEETDHFLNLIHNADSKESLGKIGQQIRDVSPSIR